MILRLQHVEIGVRDLPEAEEFYAGVLGLIVEAREGNSLFLRAPEEFDRWSLKLTAPSAAGVRGIAFRVGTPDELGELQRLHERLGLPVREMPSGLEPGIGVSLRVLTAEGYPLKFVHAVDEIDVYHDNRVLLAPRHTYSKRGPGLTRLDHVNLRVPDLEAAFGYWRDSLNFSISEMVLDQEGKPRGAWLRRKTGTHDVGFGVRTPAAFHHFAYYLAEPASVIAAVDLFADLGRNDAVERGPGRHGVTNALYLYVRDPSGNRIELYHGDYHRDLDRPPIRWSWDDFRKQGSNWWGSPAPASWVDGTSLLSDGWI